MVKPNMRRASFKGQPIKYYFTFFKDSAMSFDWRHFVATFVWN